MAQRAETIVVERSLTSCVSAHFPDRLQHYAWTALLALSYFVGSRVYACLGVTCHLHFQQSDQGLLCAPVGTWGGMDT